MIKVITYGSYDMLHYGHLRLLERAKSLGDYLIVGVTSDDYDKSRGKINIQQPLFERIKAIKDTGLADEIIVEEYEGQKIDDILRYDVDVFAIGSDWRGKFDYLNQYCEVVYLKRTEGVSSSEIRTKVNRVKVGFAGNAAQVEFAKYILESKYVNGIEIAGFYSDVDYIHNNTIGIPEEVCHYSDYQELMQNCDAVYLAPHPDDRYAFVKEALINGKHVLCKSPLALSEFRCRELFNLAKEKKLVLMDAIKTGYSTAYNRLVLLAKSGKIGQAVSVCASCTSLPEGKIENDFRNHWNSIDSWGPFAMLPVFQILGTDYQDVSFVRMTDKRNSKLDSFTEIHFIYSNAVATITIGNGIKTEGNLVVSGTKGYIYVPAPWWKMDYFEIRYEDSSNNKRYFYQLDGEGIRYELVAFIKEINDKQHSHFSRINQHVSDCIGKTIEKYYNGENVIMLS